MQRKRKGWTGTNESCRWAEWGGGPLRGDEHGHLQADEKSDDEEDEASWKLRELKGLLWKKMT